MREELRCGDEGFGKILDDEPKRFWLSIGSDNFYFYDPVFDASAIPTTILTGVRQNKTYEFMRVSNGEIPKWHITSIKDKNGFHADNGERAANDLFGKILSRDKDDVYYIPSYTNYNGLMFSVYKSNVEKKVLEFLANLKNVETEDELRALVWEFKYGSAVSEWIASPVEYLNREFALNDNEENAIDGSLQINEIGTIIDIDEKRFSLTTEEDRLYLFMRIKRESDDKIDETAVRTVNQIEGKRGHWFYTFNRVRDTDKWRIVSKIREK